MLTGLSWLPYALCSVCPMAPPSGTIPQAHLLLMCLTSPIIMEVVTDFIQTRGSHNNYKQFQTSLMYTVFKKLIQQISSQINK